MFNQDKPTNIDVEFESETTSGHREIEEVDEERPEPIIFRLRQEPRFNMIKLRQKKNFAMRRV